MDAEQRVDVPERQGAPLATREPADRSAGNVWRRLNERARRWPVTRFGQRYLIQHHAGDLAAGIAFHALLYLFPMIGAILAVIGLILRDEDLLIQTSIRVVQLFPGNWQDRLQTLLATRNNTGLFGFLSLIGLFWLGSSFLASLGRAFNILYEAPPRNLVRQRLVSVALILIFAALLLATIVASSAANLVIGVSEEVLWRLGARLPASRIFTSVLAFGASLVTAFGLFVTLYWWLPNARQRFADIWRGAALAAVLLVAATQVFPLFVRFAPANPYGAAFGFVFFLTIWLYLVAHILLLGAAINAFRRMTDEDVGTSNV